MKRLVVTLALVLFACASSRGDEYMYLFNDDVRPPSAGGHLLPRRKIPVYVHWYQPSTNVVGDDSYQVWTDETQMWFGAYGDIDYSKDFLIVMTSGKGIANDRFGNTWEIWIPTMSWRIKGGTYTPTTYHPVSRSWNTRRYNY